jgi:hypothetical protein
LQKRESGPKTPVFQNSWFTRTRISKYGSRW